MKIFFSKLSTNGIAGFGGLNLFLVVILSEVTVQCVISIYRQGSSTLPALRFSYKARYVISDADISSKCRDMYGFTLSLLHNIPQ
jgi:hypothetical protein